MTLIKKAGLQKVSRFFNSKAIYLNATEQALILTRKRAFKEVSKLGSRKLNTLQYSAMVAFMGLN